MDNSFPSHTSKTPNGNEPPTRDSIVARSHPSLISIIIATRSGADVIGYQLEALAGQTYGGPWELLVIDNGSEDNTSDVVRGWHDRLPRLRLISASERHGAAYARNVGALEAKGDFLVFCDDDDIVDTGWLEAMAESAPLADLVGGRLDVERLSPPWHPRGEFPSNGLARLRGFLAYTPGGNMGIWTEVHQQIGGWAEDFWGAEDIELSWRAQLSSHTLAFAPDALVHYRMRSTMKTMFLQAYRDGRKWPALYRSFREAGMPPSGVLRAIVVWGSLVLSAPVALWSRRRRATWLRRAGQRSGRLIGSARSRVFYL